MVLKISFESSFTGSDFLVLSHLVQNCFKGSNNHHRLNNIHSYGYRVFRPSQHKKSHFKGEKMQRTIAFHCSHLHRAHQEMFISNLLKY